MGYSELGSPFFVFGYSKLKQRGIFIKMQYRMNLRSLMICCLTLVCISLVQAQISYGIEARTTYNKTHNRGEITGASSGFVVAVTDDWGDPWTYNYSLGLLMGLGNTITFKLHIGRHQNGRVMDFSVMDDTFSEYEDQNVLVRYDYLQFTPAISYRASKGAHAFPFELGLSINKSIKKEDIVYFINKAINYDVRLSAGYEYSLSRQLSVGLNAVFSRAINNYLDNEWSYGSFLPTQIGAELNVKYVIKGDR